MFTFVVTLHALGDGYADGSKILYLGNDREMAREAFDNVAVVRDERCVRLVTWLDGKPVGDEKKYL